MKFARFEGKHIHTGWYVITEERAYPFSLITLPTNNESPTNASEMIQAIYQQQELQCAKLMELRRKRSLPHLVEMLEYLKAGDNFYSWHVPLHDKNIVTLPPIQAISFRDFYAFEQHVR